MEERAPRSHDDKEGCHRQNHTSKPRQPLASGDLGGSATDTVKKRARLVPAEGEPDARPHGKGAPESRRSSANTAPNNGNGHVSGACDETAHSHR